MSTLQIRIAATAGGVLVAAIGFLVSTRVLDAALEVPAGPGGGSVPLTLPRIIAVTLLAIVIGLLAAVVAERRLGHPQRIWFAFSLVGLVLSMVPTALLVEDLGDKGLLAIIHLVVASIVIPLVGMTLPERRVS